MSRPDVVSRDGRQYIGCEMVVTRIIRLNRGETPAQAMERFWDAEEDGADFIAEACADTRWLGRYALDGLGDLELQRTRCNGDDDEQ